MPDAAVAALSLGGNIGDVAGAFRYALDRLAATNGVELIAESSIHRTPPWGKTDQPDFLNMAALLRVAMSARAVLDLCLAIEKERGRVRVEHWGPRALDIDLLTYGDAIIDEPGLILPHPFAAQRAFVLAPLAEIAPDLLFGGKRVAHLLAAIEGGKPPA